MSWLDPSPVQQRRTMSVAGGSPSLGSGVGVAMEARTITLRALLVDALQCRPGIAGRTRAALDLVPGAQAEARLPFAGDLRHRRLCHPANHRADHARARAA